MTIYVEDFSGSPLGSTAAGWTNRWTTGDVTWPVEADAEAPGGRRMRVSKTATNRSLLTFDAVNADVNRATFDVVALVRCNNLAASGSIGSIVGRASGGSTTPVGYYGGLSSTGSVADGTRNALILAVRNGSTAVTTLGQTAPPPGLWAGGALYWLRMRGNGDSISTSIADYATPETPLHTHTVADATVSAAGWIGVSAGLSGAQFDVLYFAVGTGADLAPYPVTGPEAVTFDGAVTNQTGVEGAAFSLDLSTYFSGTETPFTYSVQAGTLPAGLSLNSSTGVISGTPTAAGVSSGIVIRATDATPDTADTNSFSITINAEGDVTPPTLTSQDATATGPHDITASVATNEAGGTLYAVLTTSATAPSEVQIKAGQDHAGAAAAGFASAAVELAGVQTLYFVALTPATTYYAHFVQTDASANDSAVVTSAAETTEAVGVVKITTAPIKNNTGTVLTSLTIAKVVAIRLSDMTLAATYSNVTTHATTGVLVLNGGSLVDGVDYLVVTSSADGLDAGVRKYTALES